MSRVDAAGEAGGEQDEDDERRRAGGLSEIVAKQVGRSRRKGVRMIILVLMSNDVPYHLSDTVMVRPRYKVNDIRSSRL